MQSSALRTTTRICLVTMLVLADRGSAGLASGASPTLVPAHRVSEAALPPRDDRLIGYRRLPMLFVENRGQSHAKVLYSAEGRGRGFYLTRDAVVMALERASANGEGLALALQFAGHNRAAIVVGEERAPGTFNYLRGSDPSGWRTAVPGYAQVVYRNLWPGVDMALRDESGALKYEFRIRPGARAADIGLAYAGAKRLSLDGTGGLLIDTDLGVLRDTAPVAYQTIQGRHVRVPSRFNLTPGGTGGEYGFEVADYDLRHELVIDPGVEYSTFLGGSSHELVTGVAVDAAGQVFAVGTTQSPNFPTTNGAFRRTGAAGNAADVFVSKLNAAGTGLIYSTFVGGSNFDFGRRIAVDAGGNAYVTGQTKSSNFPTTGGAFDRTFNVLDCPRCGIDQYDAFVTKLNAAGSALVYSTFLGGTDIDDARGIAVDGAGNAYVTGETVSRDFPIRAGSVDTSHNGAYDVFVTKLNGTGSALVYSTFLGGAQVDNGERVAVDANGSAYVTGFTSSIDFPTSPGAFDVTANGAFDVFITRLNAAGSAIVYSTFLGGGGFDSSGGLAVDATGSAYVSGGTGSLDFPTTVGALDAVSDGSDAFVTRLSPNGTSLLFSTVLGGADSDGANAVALDAGGAVWVSGITGSTDFPVTSNAFDPTFNGVADAFVAELSGDGSTLVYSTYLGGAQSDSGNDVVVDVTGDAYVGGHTYSLDFPVTAGAVDTVFNGDTSIFWGDGFVTKITIAGDGSAPSAPPGVPPAPTLVGPPNGDTPPQPITFHWNGVPSAVSYTIQIDDSSNFSSPLLGQSVTTPMFVAGDLATVPHFWRVRGVNSAGTAGAWSAVRSFTPQAASPPATLSTMSTNPSTVVGGNPSSATAVLSVPAPSGGALLALSSSHPSIASVPPSATVPAFGFTATFAIATAPVAATTTVTITAAYNGTSRTATLTLTPAAAPQPPVALQSLSLSAATVAAGSTIEGHVGLSGAAPAGGISVSMSSSHPGILSVPPSVAVFPGVTGATFTASTGGVSAATTVTISATYAGSTRSASVIVTPATAPASAMLAVTASGRGGERVVSSPAGINVATGSSGSASFPVGTAITLSVSNGRDAIWSGACSSGGNKRRTCTFTLTGAAAVTANVQ